MSRMNEPATKSVMPKRDSTVLEPAAQDAVGTDLLDPAADEPTLLPRGRRNVEARLSNSDASRSVVTDVIAYAIVGVRFLTLGLTLLVWSAVGFVFWVPLLARNTIAFTSHTLYANLRHGNATVSSLGLEHAITFYVNGFQNIIGAVLQPERHAGPYSGPTFRVWRMLGETVLALTFWWLILFAASQSGLANSELRHRLTRPFVATYEVAEKWLGEAFTPGLGVRNAEQASPDPGK
jgi:hypothetical protein